MPSALPLIVFGGIGCYLIFQGRAISTLWLLLNLLDTYRSLRHIRPNHRRIGQNTRRKVTREALIPWIVYVGIQLVGNIPDKAFGWLPLHNPMKIIILLAFLGTRTTSSSSIYGSIIVPILKRYETPIDLTILLIQSLSLLIYHYFVVLPLHGLRDMTGGLVSWTREKSIKKEERIVEMPDVDVDVDVGAGAAPEQDGWKIDRGRVQRISAIYNEKVGENQERTTPTARHITINVSTPSPSKPPQTPRVHTPEKRPADLRPPSPPMTLCRSPRRPSPLHPEDARHPSSVPIQAGPSRLPPVTRHVNPGPAPSLRATNIPRTKPAAPKSTLPKLAISNTPLRRKKVATTSLAGSLALHQPPPRFARPISRTKAIHVYPKLPDLPPSLAQLPLARPSTVSAPRPNAASRARATRLAKGDENAVVGSKRSAGIMEGEKRKRSKPSNDDKG